MTPAPIVTTFTAHAPALDGHPEPEVRLRRFLKRLARDYQIRVEWGPSLDESSSESAKPVNFTDSTAPILQLMQDAPAPILGISQDATKGGADGQ